MSKNAKRYSKRQARKNFANLVRDLNARADKIKGQIVITPKALLKGYVKWNAAILRAVRPLAQEWGITVRADEPGKLVFS
jgi:hypothetical protein